MPFTEDDDITEMKSLEVDRVDAVGSPANGTGWLVLKAGGGSGVGGAGTAVSVTIGDTAKAKYSAEQLRKLYKQGKAMKGPNGNIDYPIADDEDLRNAIHAVGRGNSPHDEIRRYIKKRAKALGHTDWIPDTWSSGGASKNTQEGGWRMSKHAQKAQKAPTIPDSTMPHVDAAGASPDPIGQSTVTVSSHGPDGTAETSPSPSEVASLPADGDSSALGSQTVDPSALEGQTMENCKPAPDGDSAQLAHQHAQTQKAKKKGKKKGKNKLHMHNPQHPDTDVDATKAAGDADGERTDVSLGQQASGKLREALSLVQQFTHREETEATDAAAVKEIHMTQDELVNLAALLGAAAKKDAKKAAKKAKVKAAKKAAKRIGDIEERLQSVETQPVRNRPILSGAAGPAPTSSAFKSLEDRVADAKERRDSGAFVRAAKQLSTAKLIAIENARRDGRLPHPVDLPDGATPILTGSHLLPADPHIRGI